MRLLIVLCFSLFGSFTAIGSILDSIPKVFMIGEFSQEHEKFVQHRTTLLEVSSNDVFLAYDKWMNMLTELNNLAESSGVDLKSTKFWFNVCWEKNGAISHFAYYLKPGSKMPDMIAFKDLLSSFVEIYKMPVTANTGFSNYGSAVFPITGRKQLASKSK